MKYKYYIVLFLWIVIPQYLHNNLFANGSVENPRIIFSINEHWNFSFMDNEGEYPSISEDNRQYINLPHTWNINDALTDTSTFLRGIGWYEKKLKLPENLQGKRIYLFFEGANQIAEVFVNGKIAGDHIGGYTAFRVDITELIHFDRKANTILVKVDNRFNKDVPPLSADFTFYGGIYRDVWLIATEEVHFSLDEYGSKGIYISTPQVNAENGRVRIHGEIENYSNENKEIVIVNTIYDPHDEAVVDVEIKVNAEAGAQTEFAENEITIIRPELWSPEHPNLYTVKSEIFISGKLTDVVFNPLGLRWYKISADSGFHLNGESYRLIGTNRHQDYDGLGNALDDQLHIADMKMIKEAGFNFLRLAHYPQDPAVLKAADELGLILWEEIPIVNYITASKAFHKNSLHMLKEMIHQHFNHPSVIFWGYMNEVFLYDADGNRSQQMNFPEEYMKSTLQLAEDLNGLAHKEDPARLTVIAAHHSDIYDKTGISAVPDAVGYNLYQGWYSSHFEDFGKSLDKMHNQFVHRKIIVSEYGAGSDERIHTEDPQAFDFSTEYQQLYHESYLRQIIDRPYLVATAVWAQNDFGSNNRGDTKPKVNQKGLQYFNRKPKDIYYLYQSQLSNSPTVHIASHDWKTRYSSTDKVSLPLKVYTNLKELDIYVDHQPIGSFEIDESCILNLDLDLTIGKHFIEANGTIDSAIYSDQIELDILQDRISHFDPSQSIIEILVNIGSSGQYQDQTGLIWRKDREYSNGSYGYNGGEPRPIYGSKSVLGTMNDPVFQTYRKGLTSYRFDVPSGIYEVELCFAEMEHQNENERVMDISINELPVWEDLDLVKDYGYLRAVTKKFEIYTSDNHGIEIKIDAKKGLSVLNGIRIKDKRFGVVKW